MKVRIGSRYEGIPFDRPALRQLPRGWVIEGTRKTSSIWRWYSVAETLVCILAAAVLLYAAVDAIARTI